MYRGCASLSSTDSEVPMLPSVSVGIEILCVCVWVEQLTSDSPFSLSGTGIQSENGHIATSFRGHSQRLCFL